MKTARPKRLIQGLEGYQLAERQARPKAPVPQKEPKTSK